MSILDLSCELIFLIADHLTSPRDIHHLLLAHRGLAAFMAPVLSRHASHPAHSAAALFCFAANRNISAIQSQLTALRRWDPHITTDADSILNQGPNLVWKSPCEGNYEWCYLTSKIVHTPSNTVQRALHWAVVNNKPAMIKFLIEKGAEVDYRDPKTGGKAIDHAIRLGSAETVKLLIENGADVSVWEKKCGSLLHCTIECIRREPPARWTEMEPSFSEIMVLLLEGGADISVQDLYGHTALHLAVLSWHAIVPLLLEWGADINALDSRNNTPLHLAVLSPPSNAVASMLLKGGADPTIKNIHGRMPVCLVSHLTTREAVGSLVGATVGHQPGKCCRSTPPPRYTGYDFRLWPFRIMRSEGCLRSPRLPICRRGY